MLLVVNSGVRVTPHMSQPLGQVSVINTSTMSTPWDPAIATALDGTTVTIKPGTTCSGVVRFNIFVEYLSHETAGQLTSVTNSWYKCG